MRQASLDLASLVAQKGELQVEKAGLLDTVAELRRERQLMLDSKEELQERVEHLEEEIELLGRSAQDMARAQQLQRQKALASRAHNAAHADSRTKQPTAAGVAAAQPAQPAYVPMPAAPSPAEFASPRVVASTRTSLGGSGPPSSSRVRGESSVGWTPSPTTASGGEKASGGRQRAESKFSWPFGSSKKLADAE